MEKKKLKFYFMNKKYIFNKIDVIYVYFKKYFYYLVI